MARSNAEAYKAQTMPQSMTNRLKELHRFINTQGGGHTGEACLRQIHAVADTYMRELVTPFTPACHAGCDTCCHVPIELTAIEAMYIADMTNTAIQLGSAPMAEIDTASPCPFLADSLCSIYPFRPLACRMFATFEPVEMCQGNDKSHALHSVKASDFWLQEVIGWMAFNSRHIEIGTFPVSVAQDIRKWFTVNG